MEIDLSIPTLYLRVKKGTAELKRTLDYFNSWVNTNLFSKYVCLFSECCKLIQDFLFKLIASYWYADCSNFKMRFMFSHVLNYSVFIVMISIDVTFEIIFSRIHLD